jgi:hypothetical protein
MSTVTGINAAAVEPICYALVDRRRHLTLREFKKEYFRKRPVVVEDGIEHWNARSSWSFETFRSRYGRDVILATPYLNGSYQGDQAKQMPLGEFIEAARTETFETFPYYLIYNYSLLNDHRELWRDFDEPTYCFDWYKFIPRAVRFPSPRIYIGPAGAVSKLHQDRWGTHFWMAQFEGRKRWIMFSPDQADLLYKTDGSGAALTPYSVQPDVPDYERFPKFKKAKGMECTIGPGDLLIVPGDWVHWVKSLDATISLTHNYMARGNFWPALKGQFKWTWKYMLNRGQSV